MRYDVIFNHTEIWLWIAVGAGFIVQAMRVSAFRRLKITAAVTFVIFGITDWIELCTGAWWRPWWLFALKAACVVSMFILLSVYLKKKPRRSVDEG